jgi:hypothetical protein
MMVGCGTVTPTQFKQQWGDEMNLPYVYKLLTAANEQPHGFLQIRGRQANREIRLMAEAGLVDATLSDGKTEALTAINRVTDLGQSFLRSFKTPPRTARKAGMAGEWDLNP